MSDRQKLSRRGFLRASAVIGGSLVIGVYLPELDPARADDKGPTRNPSTNPAMNPRGPFQPNAFVRIAPDDTVTVLINHSEMGQGTMTSLSQIVAEELDCDWSKVRAEHAPVAPAYNHVAFGIQMVGGSTSTWTEYDRLRQAGAAAKAMLLTAAAQMWNVDAGTLNAENGLISQSNSDKKASYGSLVERATKLPVPKEVKLKDPKDFKLIGKPIKRLDTPEKVNGTAMFGIDVKLPGMLTAVVLRGPTFTSKLKSFNADEAKKMPGVKHIVQIDRGVAVVADGFWPALKARATVTAEWDEGKLATLESNAQREEYAQLASKPGAVARKEGDADAAFDRAAKKFEAVYDLPYLAHAPMEPQNAVADVRPDGCDVYTGTQFQTVDHAAAMQETGLPADKVRIHTMLLGGGFGRRAVIDSHMVREAVQISKQIKLPVKVIWTREDDTRGGYYRPAAYHVMRGGIDGSGNITAWSHRIVCQSFMKGTPFEAFIVKDGVDETAVEGGKDIPYSIPNVFVDWHEAPPGVPCLWLRSVGHSHNAFAVESFLDEMIHAAKKDPVEVRRAMLKDKPRHLAVLNLAAEKAGWGKPAPAGIGRGVAVHESFGSFVAQVAEVAMVDGRPRVKRVVVAIDCGPTVNPDGIKAQMESGVVFGITAALWGKISFKDGRVQQGNFNDYPMLRMNESPVIEAYVVDSKEKMGGVGETGVPPIAPAICNAIFALTGQRVRRLPICEMDFKTA
ncbi:xanthine dehydrogenase family protein molybdopterin-binding subunit [soil metagenome]